MEPLLLVEDKSELRAMLRKALERGPIMAQVGRVSEEPSEVEAKYIGNFTVEFTE